MRPSPYEVRTQSPTPDSGVPRRTQPCSPGRSRTFTHTHAPPRGPAAARTRRNAPPPGWAGPYKEAGATAGPGQPPATPHLAVRRKCPPPTPGPHFTEERVPGVSPHSPSGRGRGVVRREEAEADYGSEAHRQRRPLPAPQRAAKLSHAHTLTHPERGLRSGWKEREEERETEDGGSRRRNPGVAPGGAEETGGVRC